MASARVAACEQTTSGAFIGKLAAAFRGIGIDPRQLVSGEVLAALRDGEENADAVVPFGVYRCLWHAAAQARVAVVGLRAACAEATRPLTLAEHVLFAAPNLFDCIVHHVELQRLLYHTDVVRIQVDSTTVSVEIDPASGYCTTPDAVDYLALSTLRHLRDAQQAPDLTPVRVSFRHSQPDGGSAYRELFGCPVSFRNQENRLELPRRALERCRPSFSAATYSALLTEARRLAARPWGRGVRYAVEDVVRRQIGAVPIAVDQIAGMLHLSRRTLQRRLADEGSSLQEIIDQVRRELALTAIREGASLAEAAALAGYRDSSSVWRACHRWAAASPTRL